MYDTYDQLPLEMQEYRQWVVWRYETAQNGAPTKVLYNPLTGYKASHSDPNTWAQFAEAVAVARAGTGFNGIGFVFTKSDPYAGCDLDVKEGCAPSDIQKFILNRLDSYAEYSPSGRGVHIIVKGSIPQGRNNRDYGVELYDNERYFTMTGNRVNGKPIEDRTSLFIELWSEMGGVFDDANGEPHSIQNPTAITDEKLIANIVASGRNKAYFNWVGDFDWSEAYRSVLGAACLFSSDEQQVRRVILASPMVTNAPPHGTETRPNRVARLWAKEYNYAARQGDTERGDAPYRLWSQKWFPGGSREQYEDVVAKAKASAEAMIATHNNQIMGAARTAAQNVRNRDPKSDMLPLPLTKAGLISHDDLNADIPPGMFSDLVSEICSRTRNPSQIMAIWAALGFISGAVGRSYVTQEGSGVNNFFILSAGSNTGKTQHWSAMTAIVRQCAPKLVQAVFGGDTSSAQIIAKEGQKTPSMILRLPDAGPWLKGIVEGKTQIQLQMRSSLLNIYEAAGAGNEWHIPKSLRAKDDNNETIDEFNLSIALDTTPQYVSDFDLSDFTDGLMSRFVMVYGPEAISFLQEPKTSNDVPPHLAHMFENFVQLGTTHARPTNVGSLGAMGVPDRIVVRHEDGLKQYLWNLEVEITDHIRNVQTRKLPPHYIAASRVVLNAKRVAACVAMIENPAEPLITRAIYDWALRFVMQSVTSVIGMFDLGTMGSEESKQEAAIIDYLERRVIAKPDQPYVTLSELGRYVDKLACFSKAKMGARYTRQRVLADLFDRGILEKITIQTNTKPKQVITFATSD